MTHFIRHVAATAAVIAMVAIAARIEAQEAKQQEIELPKLPYADTALEPVISAKTISFHYGKHHKAYVDKVNALLKDSPLRGKPLEQIVKASAEKEELKSLFNNAAQAWNHDFFWKSMKPSGGGAPKGKLLEALNASFGSFDNFKKQFVENGVAQFGSGWIWVVQDGTSLKVVKTANADTPITRGLVPLLVCDVWEHAYYLDYQNRRADFLGDFLDKLANWEFAEKNLK